jgi:hypothetical protein
MNIEESGHCQLEALSGHNPVGSDKNYGNIRSAFSVCPFEDSFSAPPKYK